MGAIGMTEALRQLGFTTPLVYAAAVYGLFHLLDKRASGQAKRAISSWLKPLDYDKAAVATAMVEVFDGLYTQPLLRWRAFLRSLFFTTVVTIVFVYEFYPIAAYELLYSTPKIQALLALQFIFNILSNYISLFIVRRWLYVAGRSPLFALCAGPVVGSIIIVLLWFVRDTLHYILIRVRWSDILSWSYPGVWFFFVISPDGAPTRALIIPAMAVHLWLPLFGLGVIFVQAANRLVWAISKMQWFLKQGQHHPLQAIGYVAAIVVFLGTIIAQRIVSLD